MNWHTYSWSTSVWNNRTGKWCIRRLSFHDSCKISQWGRVLWVLSLPTTSILLYKTENLEGMPLAYKFNHILASCILIIIIYILKMLNFFNIWTVNILYANLIGTQENYYCCVSDGVNTKKIIPMKSWIII